MQGLNIHEGRTITMNAAQDIKTGKGIYSCCSCT